VSTASGPNAVALGGEGAFAAWARANAAKAAAQAKAAGGAAGVLAAANSICEGEGGGEDEGEGDPPGPPVPNYEFDEDGNLTVDGEPVGGDPTEGTTPETRMPPQYPAPADGKTPTGPKGPGLWNKVKYIAAEAYRAWSKLD